MPSPARSHSARTRRPRRGLWLVGQLRLDRRLGWIIGLYLLLIACIVGYDAREIAHERGSATIVNVAARQRALAERYQKDVVLVTQGVRADPDDDAVQLLRNAHALLYGGEVTAVQGADLDVEITGARSDDLVSAKLEEERRLIGLLIASGDRLLDTPRSDPLFPLELERLRVIGAQVTSVSNDAVGQMTKDTEAAFSHLVVVTVALGFLGALVAIGMGLLMRRAGVQRSAWFRSLVHHASDLITVVGEDGAIRYQSPSAERLVGIPAEDLVGTPYLDLIEEEDRSHLHAVLADPSGLRDSTAVAEYRVRHVDGSSRYVESIVSGPMTDAEGVFVLNSRDVSDRKMLEEELAHRAFHDSLTGLSNRAVFRDRVDHALARASRTGDGLTVLLLDLDGFKMINDGLGHDAGDQLLIDVGARIRACGRESDTVARLGGDEFAILLEDEGDEGRAAGVAERILRELGAPYNVGGRDVFVRASIGIATCVAGDANTDELIRNADTAMYAAKAAGKGRYEIFRPAMHERALAEFEVQADLQRALERDEFIVHFQPIVDFATRRVTGTEALVRWVHPIRGILPPIEFIGLAEESGLIVPLGRWVLREACAQTVAWRERYAEARDLTISVNLSTRQMLEPDLVAQVRDVLQETGLEPSALVLEITEGSLMQDVTVTTLKLRQLKELGVRLAIDDFGTGSSSLAYLQRFPIDLLKIDKTFVDDVAASGSPGSALVRAIVELAGTFALDTVAEGIEESEQLDRLRSFGCASGQGYLFARPLPQDTVEALLREGALVDGPWTRQTAGSSQELVP